METANKGEAKMAQLTLGLMSGLIPMDPYKNGDILVKHDFSRYVVLVVSENNDGPVFVCINLQTGNKCVLLGREIKYRSK